MSIVSVGTIFLMFNGGSSEVNSKSKENYEGIKIIKELEAKEISEAEEIIANVQKSLQPVSSNSKIDYISKFSSSVILGDSRAESIVGYEILDNSSVVAYKGRNLLTAQKQGDIDKAINLYPKNVFLTYGLNDTGIYENSENFITEYKKVIKNIQEKLPNTTIYVNSIFDITQKGLIDNPYMSKIQEFNQALIKMCEELNIPYIDGSSIVTDESFEPDGVHFKPQFNKRWLELLINKANL